jgi:hypothetical protein
MVDLARDVTIPAMETVNRARDAADLATEATKAAGRGPSLTLMTWNASRLLSSGRELALLHLLTSLDVDIATVTECEIPETVKEFAVADYTTFFPKVPEGKLKMRVISLVKNNLVAKANVHLCPDLMDCQTQSIWLRFGPTSSKSSSSTLGAFTLCGVYRTWSNHNVRVYNVQEATDPSAHRLRAPLRGTPGWSSMAT